MLGMGMDLVGFGPASRWEHAPFLLSPQAILPKSQTVVVAAIHITDTWTEMGGVPEPQDGSPGGWMDHNSLLDRVAYHTARLLNDHGYRAIGIASSNIWRYRAFEGIPSLFAPDLSHIHAAVAAGLGEIGWSGLAITPEFGSRCRFVSVVTDAPLEPTPMYSGPPLCDRCMECVRHCATGSLRTEIGPPHVVEIGGRTYKYANQNMWRCAWAEHFGLDLKSPTLTGGKVIDEEVIRQELAAKGRRGHERGVCQKVCVPPHLRSDRPSFGRDRQIAQNRINRRYPESMPTLRKMRDDLAAHAHTMGVDIVSVGALDEATDAGKQALDEVPGVRTVIGLAAGTPPEARTQPPGATVNPWHYACGVRMHHALLRLARMIEDYGYHAASYTGHLAANQSVADRLAAMSGLGTCDEHGSLVVPEFDRDVIVGAITTDAPLDPTPVSLEVSRPPARRRLSGHRLRFELERVARENLVDFIGVASPSAFGTAVEDLRRGIDESALGESVVDAASESLHGPFKPQVRRDSCPIRHPRDYVADARSVIVMGMRFPPELIANAGLETTKQIGAYAFCQYQTCLELCFASTEVAKCLSTMGYNVAICVDMLGIGSSVRTPRGPLPDARCNALEALAAGLGEIGKSGALLTPEDGPHQRRVVIVTNADIPADAPNTSKGLCTDCKSCLRTCPMDAIDEQTIPVRVGEVTVEFPVIPRHRCDWAKRYALCAKAGVALSGDPTDVMPPAGRTVTIEDIAAACGEKDWLTKKRTCVLEACLRNCPAGPKA